MSFVKVKSHGLSATETDEYLVSSSDDTANLPTDAPVGSFAFTADLTYVAVKDLDGSWKAAVEPEPDETEPAAEEVNDG